MQRSIEQRHSPKRRVSARRHPHAKTFGFTARQWPFILVLVGNWIFSLAFFLGVETRLALGAGGVEQSRRSARPRHQGRGVCAAAGRDRHLHRRRAAPRSEHVGRARSQAQFVARHQHPLHPQHLRAVRGLFRRQCGSRAVLPARRGPLLALLTALFLLGRILFWIGYHQNPYLRAFGFGITFYPTMGAFIWLVLFMVFGFRIPL